MLRYRIFVVGISIYSIQNLFLHFSLLWFDRERYRHLRGKPPTPQLGPRSYEQLKITSKKQITMEDHPATSLLPSDSPEQQHQQQQDALQHGQMQQQGFIGFGMDPNWGFGQVMHGQHG